MSRPDIEHGDGEREPLEPRSIPPSPSPARGWLLRSGNDWKVQVARYAGIPPVVLLASWMFTEPARYKQSALREWWLAAAIISVLMSNVLVLVLRRLVRCQVCGLHLASCARARELGYRKWSWVARLEACPVCGDDGSASASVRAQWASKDTPAEDPYWSPTRLAVALLLAALLLIASIWYGSSYRPNPTTWSKDFIR
jgi:hypothetical protein